MYGAIHFKHVGYKHIPLMLLLTATTPAFAQDFGIYGEIYGGARLATPVTAFNTITDAGGAGAFGASIGLMTPIDGLAFELDFMRSKVVVGGDPELTLQSTTVMVNAEYSFHATDVFDVYGGLGLGSMSLDYSDDGSSLPTQGAAYQFIVGGRAHMNEHLAAFVEYKYANTFNTLENTGAFFRSPNHYVLAGLRLSY